MCIYLQLVEHGLITPTLMCLARLQSIWRGKSNANESQTSRERQETTWARMTTQRQWSHTAAWWCWRDRRATTHPKAVLSRGTSPSARQTKSTLVWNDQATQFDTALCVFWTRVTIRCCFVFCRLAQRCRFSSVVPPGPLPIPTLANLCFRLKWKENCKKQRQQHRNNECFASLRLKVCRRVQDFPQTTIVWNDTIEDSTLYNNRLQTNCRAIDENTSLQLIWRCDRKRSQSQSLPTQHKNKLQFRELE